MSGMTTREEREYRSNIRKAYIFKFLMMFHMIAGALIPFFTIWGGIRFSRVMILNAIFFTSIFIMEVPTGAIADRFGRKVSLVLSGVATGAAALVYSSYPNFWIFVCGEVLWGLGFSLSSGADQALVYDSLKKLGDEGRSKKIFGQWQSLGMISISVAAPVGSLVAKYMGLRSVVLLMAIPMLLASMIALTFKEPDIPRHEQRPKYFRTIKDGFRYLRGHKALQILAFDYISISAMSFFIVWVYQVILQKQDVPLQWFGFICAGLTLAEVAVLNNYSLLDRVFGGKRKYSFISALIIGASFVALGISRSVPLSIALMTLIAAFGLTRGPLFQNYMNKFIESRNRATVLSVVSMFYSMSTAILNLAWGYLVDWNLRATLMMIGTLILALSIFSRVEEEHLLD